MAKFLVFHRWDDKSKVIINKDKIVTVCRHVDNKRTVILAENDVSYVAESLDEVYKSLKKKF